MTIPYRGEQGVDRDVYEEFFEENGERVWLKFVYTPGVEGVIDSGWYWEVLTRNKYRGRSIYDWRHPYPSEHEARAAIMTQAELVRGVSKRR